MKTRFLRRIDPAAGLTFIEAALPQMEPTPQLCQEWAEVALAAGWPNKALEACRRALKLQPGLYWAHRAEGSICLELGRPTEAAAALAPVRAALVHDPDGCGVYVRALCACGSYVLAEQFLSEVQADKRPLEVLLEAARGLQSAGRHEEASRWAKHALDRDPGHAPALVIRADSLRELAELDDGGWDRDKVREAIRHYQAVLNQQPDNLVVANNVVWLELKALGRPDEALKSSAPLSAARGQSSFPAEFMDTLGAVYVAVGRYEDARKLLVQAIGAVGPRASFFMHLALAHHGLKQPELAERSLARAAELPMSPRERAELVEVTRTVRGGR
jgi:tetratricopeptide (TPR) repeat protein